jgi:hypothetical protein
VYDIQILNFNTVDISEEFLQDTLLIKANLMSQIPKINNKNKKDAQICEKKKKKIGRNVL